MNNSVKEKVRWLQLYRTEGIGPITFWRLLQKHGSAERAIEAIKGSYKVHKESLAQEEIEKHQKLGMHVVAAFEKDFPQILRHIPDCPPILSVYGHKYALKIPMVGIVGARNASIGGRSLSFNIAKGLSGVGVCVVSGMARGIDVAAHKGALAVSRPTVAVLAGGVDCIYPTENTEVYKKIYEPGGAVISESPLGTRPIANLFIRRNRLISGLSHGVVVIEAAKQSGSLSTAEFAATQGREVFVVPGSPLDPRCLGSNGLIKQGATLIERAEDVLSA